MIRRLLGIVYPPEIEVDGWDVPIIPSSMRSSRLAARAISVSCKIERIKQEVSVERLAEARGIRIERRGVIE